VGFDRGLPLSLTWCGQKTCRLQDGVVRASDDEGGEADHAHEPDGLDGEAGDVEAGGCGGVEGAETAVGPGGVVHGGPFGVSTFGIGAVGVALVVGLGKAITKLF
jgi:hypothetical protein